jgi:hypothetical protein
MVRLGLTDLRRGIVLLPVDATLPPVDVPVQPPGTLIGQPYGIARLPDGRLVTADRAGHRIVAVAEDGSDFASFGVRGAGEGQFEAPSGVAVDPAGRIYIADTGNFRVAAIDSMAGDGWQAYGTKIVPVSGDAGIGGFARLVGIAAGAGGLVVVADAGAARVVRLTSFDEGGWDASPAGAFRNPVAVTLLPDGTIVAADLAARHLALLWRPSDGIVELIADPLLPGPTAVAALDDDHLAVCCVPNNALVSIARAGGVWSVTLERTLDDLAIRRPTAICPLA